MDDEAGTAALITVAARADGAYPGILFVSLRRYDPHGDDAALETVEVASADEAIEVVDRWLRSIAT